MGSEKSKADVVQQQYRRRFSQAEDYRNALWSVLCSDFFQSYIDPQSVLLDLGCGWGEFSNNILARNKYAMDMNPDAADRLNNDVELNEVHLYIGKLYWIVGNKKEFDKIVKSLNKTNKEVDEWKI